MDAIRNDIFSDAFLLSKHNFYELEELAIAAMEAEDVWHFVWKAFRDSDDMQIPVGLMSLLEIAKFKSDELLSSIQTYHSCVSSGKMFNPPY